MNPSEIKITISGLAGSGKSGIGFAIQEFLKEMGLDATFNDLDGAENTYERASRVIESLAQRGTKITINEQQAKRDSYATY
jgi:adenylylsulfate kinase-like enzyme